MSPSAADPKATKTAAFDLGSNALKLIVVAAGPPLTVLHEEEQITRIGEGVAGGELAPAAITRTVAAFEDAAARARSLGAHRISAVATAGLRAVRDPSRFIEDVRARTGVDLEIISGDREARLSFLSTRREHPGSRLVLDIGGRSTELAFGSGDTPLETRSLPVGGVALTERFRPDGGGAEAWARLDAHLDDVLSTVKPERWRRPGAVGLATSGTVLAVAGLEHHVETLGEAMAGARSGWTLDAEVAGRWARRLAERPASERLRGSLVPRGRADVLPAGAHWLARLLTHLDMSVRVGSGSVGLGLALEALSNVPQRA